MFQSAPTRFPIKSYGFPRVLLWFWMFTQVPSANQGPILRLLQLPGHSPSFVDRTDDRFDRSTPDTNSKRCSNRWETGVKSSSELTEIEHDLYN